jgi:hypothetical protein
MCSSYSLLIFLHIHLSTMGILWEWPIKGVNVCLSRGWSDDNFYTTYLSTCWGHFLWAICLYTSLYVMTLVLWCCTYQSIYLSILRVLGGESVYPSIVLSLSLYTYVYIYMYTNAHMNESIRFEHMKGAMTPPIHLSISLAIFDMFLLVPYSSISPSVNLSICP